MIKENLKKVSYEFDVFIRIHIKYSIYTKTTTINAFKLCKKSFANCDVSLKLSLTKMGEFSLDFNNVSGNILSQNYSEIETTIN